METGLVETAGSARPESGTGGAPEPGGLLDIRRAVCVTGRGSLAEAGRPRKKAATPQSGRDCAPDFRHLLECRQPAYDWLDGGGSAGRCSPVIDRGMRRRPCRIRHGFVAGFPLSESDTKAPSYSTWLAGPVESGAPAGQVPDWCVGGIQDQFFWKALPRRQPSIRRKGHAGTASDGCPARSRIEASTPDMARPVDEMTGQPGLDWAPASRCLLECKCRQLVAGGSAGCSLWRSWPMPALNRWSVCRISSFEGRISYWVHRRFFPFSSDPVLIECRIGVIRTGRPAVPRPMALCDRRGPCATVVESGAAWSPDSAFLGCGCRRPGRRSGGLRLPAMAGINPAGSARSGGLSGASRSGDRLSRIRMAIRLPRRAVAISVWRVLVLRYARVRVRVRILLLYGIYMPFGMQSPKSSV